MDKIKPILKEGKVLELSSNDMKFIYEYIVNLENRINLNIEKGEKEEIKEKKEKGKEEERECLCCYEKFNNVKFRSEENGEWKNCIYCEDCILYMRKNQFLEYVEKIKTTDCKVSLERLIKQGPPRKVRDPKLSDGEVYEFLINGEIVSSQLEFLYPEEELKKYEEDLKLYLN
jgi:hypothetical protein